MEENNEELNKKINELHTAFEKSQIDLVEKFQKYMDDSKYEKEFETLRQLCKKIMDLYQLNKKEIEKITAKQNESNEIVEKKLSELLNNKAIVSNNTNNSEKVIQIEERIEKLEREAIEDRKANHIEFGKTTKKYDKEI